MTRTTELLAASTPSRTQEGKTNTFPYFGWVTLMRYFRP